jgi:hypothetical protein
MQLKNSPIRFTPKKLSRLGLKAAFSLRQSFYHSLEASIYAIAPRPHSARFSDFQSNHR